MTILYDELLKLFQSSNFQQIVNRYNTSQLNEGLDPLAAQVAAGAYFQLGDYTKSFKILENLETVFNNDPSFLSLYGATCRRLGDLSKAKSLLHKAVSLESDNPIFLNNYANLLVDMRDLKEAKKCLDSALKINPEYADAKNNLNRLSVIEQAMLTDEKFDESVDQPTNQGLWKPEDPLMFAFSEEEVVLNSQNYNNARFSEASQQSKISNKIPSSEQSAYAAEKLKLAAQAIQESNLEFSLQLITEAASLLGAHCSIYINAADAYTRQQRFMEAEICYLHALTLEGPTLPIYINLSTLARIRSDFKLAKHYFTLAKSIEPQHPQLLHLSRQLDEDDSKSKNHTFQYHQQWPSPKINMLIN